MKNTTKSIVAILLLIGSAFLFTACQEEVYPDLQTPDVVDSSALAGADGETEDEEEDKGMIPN